MTRAPALALLVAAVALPGRGAVAQPFGNGGVIEIDARSFFGVPPAIATDGVSLYVIGTDGFGSERRWRIDKRSAATGVPVTEFGDGGVAIGAAAGGSGDPTRVAVEGRFLYVAVSSAPQGSRIEKRDRETAALVTGFGSAGVVGVTGSVRAITPDADYLYVASSAGIEKRRLGDGSLVDGFGDGGIAGRDEDGIAVLALDGAALYSARQWEVLRRNAVDGALQFAIREPLPDAECGAGSIYALQGDGSALYVAGEAAGRWRIERRDSSRGQLVYRRELVSSSCDVVRALVTDGCFMYVGGEHDGTWRIEKRWLSDGALVRSFGSGGVIRGASPYYDVGVSALTVAGGALFAADAGDLPPFYGGRVEKRSLRTGQLCGPVRDASCDRAAPASSAELALETLDAMATTGAGSADAGRRPALRLVASARRALEKARDTGRAKPEARAMALMRKLVRVVEAAERHGRLTAAAASALRDGAEEVACRVGAGSSLTESRASSRGIAWSAAARSS